MSKKHNHDSEDGVQIDMISGARMDNLQTMEKIRLVLDSVRDGNVVILEQGLSPNEESKLIEVTMTEIQPNEFSGIEIETYPSEDTSDDSGGFVNTMNRVLGKSEDTSKLTVIGPADQIETLHKDESVLSTLITRH